MVIDELEPEAKRFADVWSHSQGVKLQQLSECRFHITTCACLVVIPHLSVEEFGKKHYRDVIVPSPSDLATICYTSVSSSQLHVVRGSADVN